ncbi:MAG: DnaJ domain-containing protein [Treponema sp.]|uniref:J domain-containing protein n=1 Tax=Treponema sp. TaxID=166 RepID=UPI003FA1B5D0
MQNDNLFDRLGSVLKDYIDDEDLQRQNRAKTAEKDGSKSAQAENAADKIDAKAGAESKTDTSATDKAASKDAGSTKAYSNGKNRSEPKHFGQKSRAYGIVYKALNAPLIEDFNILGLSPTADFQTCKKRYKQLLHLYHPDKYGTGTKEQEKANALTMKIHQAFKKIERYFIQYKAPDENSNKP